MGTGQSAWGVLTESEWLGSRGRQGPGGVLGQRPAGGPGGQSSPAKNKFRYFGDQFVASVHKKYFGDQFVASVHRNYQKHLCVCVL